MSPKDLAAYLAVLRGAGVRTAKVPVGDPRSTGQLAMPAACDVLVVEFEPAEKPRDEEPQQSPGEPASLFVDAEGKPVNLDEGNPHLDSDAAILKANFPATKAV